MSYIKDNYPYITTLRFEDASYRTCDNNKVIELAEMNYIYSGKTWYEMKFGAYLDGKDALDFSKANKAFQEIKKIMDWNKFKGYITIPFDESVLETIYTSSETWQDFFSQLRVKLGVSEFCIFLAPWFHRFMTVVFKLNLARLKYILPLDKSVEYSVLNYSRGGRQLTRKKLKQRPIHDT
jgi:hypothetical protein